jgi:hypothetical protein
MNRYFDHGRRILRMTGFCIFALVTGWTLTTIYLLGYGEDLHDALIPHTGFRIESRVEPEHPLITRLAADVRSVTSNRMEQAAVAEQVTWNLVRYWDTDDIWGHNCVPSIDEIIGRAAIMGWATPRGNCISQSIVLCSLLQALGFDAHIKTSPSHAFVRFQIDGKALYALYPADSLALQEHLPIHLANESALKAAQRLGANPEGLFRSLDELPAAKPNGPYFMHPWRLLLAVPFLGFWLFMIRHWDRATGQRVAPKKSDEDLNEVEAVR